MDELELWALGLMTEGLGPKAEWHPVSAKERQWFHDAFWHTVLGLVPEDEDDEPFWMSENAATELASNHLFRNN